MTCEHLNFAMDGNVHRTTSNQTGKPIAFTMSVSVSCKDCGSRFWFPGLPTGQSFRTAVTDPSGFTLIAAAVPANERCIPDPTLVEVKTATNDTFKGRTS